MFIFEDDVLKITARQGESDRKSNSVLLSFTGIGHAMGGLDVQKPEFFGTGRSFDNIIFITDKTRSWGNQLDFARIRDLVSPYIGDRKTHSIGNSMGGFNAVISTHFIPTDTCILFVPQYSVNPAIVPWETRWAEYISTIEHYRFDRVDAFMNDTTQYFIFSGGVGADLKHARLFPVKDNIHHYVFHDIAHDVARQLKENAALDKAVQGCFDRDYAPALGLRYDKLSPA